MAGFSMFLFFIGIFAGISQLSICLPVVFILIVSAFAIHLATYFLISDRDRVEFAIQRWEKVKESGWNKTNPDFKLVKGEKIAIPLTAAVIKTKNITSFRIYPRDIIVTNKRILIGFKWFGMKQTFDEMNLWHPGIGDNPEYEGRLPFGEQLGGNSKIWGVELKEVLDKKGPYDWDSVKLSLKYGPVPISFTIYTPHAKRIHGIMSNPIKE
jgi:hypothetical protein